jgi:hypothetical protein
MATLDYVMLDVQCPKCRVGLFGAKDSVSGNKIVFCTECRSGGDFEQILKNGRVMTGEFITRQFADDFVRKLGTRGE